MSKKKRGRSTAAPADTDTDADTPSGGTRKQRRSEKVREQREARRVAEKKSQGVRPWILPGFVGIAIIAIVLVGVSTLSNHGGGDSVGSNAPSPSLGERTAQVVIHEYGDFQCPFCGVFSRNIKPELKEKYFDTGIARLVWHDFAWHGTESRTSANAARCVGEQDMFSEFHDVLFVNEPAAAEGVS